MIPYGVLERDPIFFAGTPLCGPTSITCPEERMPDLELIMAEAPTIKVKVVKERKVREKKEKRKSSNDVRSRGQRSMNPRRR